MGRRLTFIHAADLHLGSPLSCLHSSSDRLSRQLSCAINDAFDRLVSEAIRRRVDFVILAGDVFDQAKPSYSEYLRFHEGLLRLNDAGIFVYMVSGNHDPADSWSNSYADLPDNVVTFFSPEVGSVIHYRHGEPLAMIAGVGFDRFSSGIPKAMPARSDACPFTVGIMHTGLNIDSSVAPVHPDDLLLCDYDYFALGHIHSFAEFPKGHPRMAYSGCLQGRDANECGDHGCVLVSLEEGFPCKIEFLPLAGIVWARVAVDVSDCQTVDQVRSSIMRALIRVARKHQDAQIVARVKIEGTSSLRRELSRFGVLEDLRGALNSDAPFYCDDIENDVKASVDLRSIADQGMFAAQVVRSSQDVLANPNGLQDCIDRCFAAKRISCPQYDDEQLTHLGLAARDLLLDLLQGDAHD